MLLTGWKDVIWACWARLGRRRDSDGKPVKVNLSSLLSALRESSGQACMNNIVKDLCDSDTPRQYWFWDQTWNFSVILLIKSSAVVAALIFSKISNVLDFLIERVKQLTLTKKFRVKHSCCSNSRSNDLMSTRSFSLIKARLFGDLRVPSSVRV